MQQEITLKLTPAEAADDAAILHLVAQTIAKPEEMISGFYILHQSIDARSRKQVWINLKLNVFIDEPLQQRPLLHTTYKELTPSAKKVIIIGAGPAGLFAALKLIEQGIQPIILERGKDVRSRRRDLAALNKDGIINPESNYCFGEGGAGTYSDGKLYTRSSKRGDINRILNLFVQFGAEEKILYQSHPHIGTNKLPQIITAMRVCIENCGGIFLFNKKVTGFIIDNNILDGVKTLDGSEFRANAVILATGHSARDIFQLLHQSDIIIEAKPFALGVRVEHPQQLINGIQYHHTTAKSGVVYKAEILLPPASYSLVQQVNGKGAFSFCMCPGGIIAPASTNANELVVNGWSPSKRDNPFANSGMVITVDIHDVEDYFKTLSPKANKTNVEVHPLLLMYFQQYVEERAYQYGGGNFVAPAQRLQDFCDGKTSASLPDCSYHPGVKPVNMLDVLPDFIGKNLQKAFIEFGKKMKGYLTNEALIVATESRTSSPVRIPRDADSLEHIQIKNLYPCGEGAGYAGGIVSAAMDGEKVADAIALKMGVI